MDAQEKQALVGRKEPVRRKICLKSVNKELRCDRVAGPEERKSMMRFHTFSLVSVKCPHINLARLVIKMHVCVQRKTMVFMCEGMLGFVLHLEHDLSIILKIFLSLVYQYLFILHTQILYSLVC